MSIGKLTEVGLRLIVSAGLAALQFPGGAAAEVLTTHRIPAVLANEAVSAAVAACTHQGFGVTATVIDVDAQRIAMLRGDTAEAHTFQASLGKAYTAVGFAPMLELDNTGEVAARIAQFAARQPPGTLPFQAPEGMIFRAGGLTVKFGDEVIGVGGAPSAEADEARAKAGLDEIRERLK